jgi:hypothetical protein
VVIQRVKSAAACYRVYFEENVYFYLPLRAVGAYQQKKLPSIVGKKVLAEVEKKMPSEFGKSACYLHVTSNSVNAVFGRSLAAVALALFERSEFSNAPKDCKQNF